MTAGIATLKELTKPGVMKKIERSSAQLEVGLRDAARRAGATTKFYRAGSMFCTYFTGADVRDHASAKTADTKTFAKFFLSMLEAGVNFAPSQSEAGFMSLAHTDRDIEKTVNAAFGGLKKI